MASVAPRLYVTGRLTLEAPGGTILQEHLPRRQGRLALAYLTLMRTQPVTRDQLAAALWPDEVPPALDAALSAVVSKLRRAFAKVRLDGIVVSGAGCYELRLPTGTWVDVEVAAVELDRAEGALRHGDVNAAWAAATVATAILRRPFLPAEDVEWVVRQRDRFQMQLLRASDCLAEAWLRRGEGALAQRVAQESLAIAPYREGTHRLLLRAHLAQGNRAEALRAFLRCRDLLVDDLGVEPSPETQAVYEAALRLGQPVVAASVQAPPEPTPSPASMDP